MRRRAAASSREDEDSKYSKNYRRGGQSSSGGALFSVARILAGIVVFLGASILWKRYSPLLSSILVSSSNTAAAQSSQQRHLPAVAVPQSSLLSPELDAQLERDSVTGIRYHVIFSTDCSPYQHWQSYLVFYTAMKVQQPGHVTRIASGCDPEQAKAMQDWFQHDVQFMSQRFHLQLTPHFSDIKNDKGETVGDYKFFNKPFGLKYWMENSPQIQFKDGKFDTQVVDDVVILIDPDMALLRPLTADFSNPRETVITPNRQSHILTTKVGPGKPAAQVYGFGAQWARLDLEKIAGSGTPAAQVSNEDALLYYPVGPPYLATVHDMYNIAVTWSSFVPGVYEQYPHLLAEMFAFCIAAAHLKLPHQMISSLMISDIGATGEGWPLIDAIPAEEVCKFAVDPNHAQYALPNVVHLCQRHAMGTDWFFSKRRVPSDVYDCASPLFQDPPLNLATAYNYAQFPLGKRKDMSPVEAVRTSFMLCYLHAILNEAATFYKRNACAPETINLAKTRNLARTFFEDNANAAQKEVKVGAK